VGERVAKEKERKNLELTWSSRLSISSSSQTGFTDVDLSFFDPDRLRVLEIHFRPFEWGLVAFSPKRVWEPRRERNDEPRSARRERHERSRDELTESLLESKIAESSGETTTMVGTLPVEVEDATVVNEEELDAT